MNPPLHPDDLRELIDICRRVKGMRVGPGLIMTNGPGVLTIGLAPKREYRPEQRASGGVGLFPILVKGNGGADGTVSTYATWTYDLYRLADTGYETKLNTDGAIQPKRSAARIVKGTVTQATDGSVGMAYYDADGAIQLWDCIEVRTPYECT